MSKKHIKGDQPQARSEDRCPSVPPMHLILDNQAVIAKYLSNNQHICWLFLFCSLNVLLRLGAEPTSPFFSIPSSRSPLPRDGQPASLLRGKHSAKRFVGDLIRAGDPVQGFSMFDSSNGESTAPASAWCG